MEERRTVKRSPVPSDLLAYYRFGPNRRRCKVRDLSDKGAFIEAPRRDLPRGTLIDLILTQGSDRIVTVRSVLAYIVHVSDEGAGLMLFARKEAARQGHTKINSDSRSS